MENLIIEKSAMKFTVEVVAHGDQLSFNVIRYIDVGKDESMDTNAKLAKHEALKINGHFINCHELMKSAINGMEATMLPVAIDVKKDRKIRLKKSCTFGY